MEAIPNYTDLIAGFQNGQEAAVREIYSMHYRPLCYFAEKLIDNRPGAEDIVVEAFLKMLQKKQEFDSLPGIKSFLYTVVRNACFDLLRKDKIHARATKELEYLSAPDEQYGEHELITAKVLQAIYTEVERLPAQRKRIFKAILMEGKTSAVVAEEMGLSVQTILNQKTKALKTLRLALSKENLFSPALFFYCLFLIAAQNRS